MEDETPGESSLMERAGPMLRESTIPSTIEYSMNYFNGLKSLVLRGPCCREKRYSLPTPVLKVPFIAPVLVISEYFHGVAVRHKT